MFDDLNTRTARLDPLDNDVDTLKGRLDGLAERFNHLVKRFGDLRDENANLRSALDGLSHGVGPAFDRSLTTKNALQEHREELQELATNLFVHFSLYFLLADHLFFWQRQTCSSRLQQSCSPWKYAVAPSSPSQRGDTFKFPSNAMGI
jgi:regulator of replication initiation timing